jgi:hypothetical protein
MPAPTSSGSVRFRSTPATEVDDVRLGPGQPHIDPHRAYVVEVLP